MQVLLTTLNAKYIHTNLAIRILYQLNKHRPDLLWKEFTIKENPETVAAYCAQFEVVAFSCYIWNITQTLVVCERIKALNPHIKILLGGPEVSYEYEAIIVRPDVDYIIAGEGEEAFASFLDQFPHVAGIPGLIYIENEHLHGTAVNQTVDLRLLESINPYADDKLDELAHKVLYVETSRGCPYKCEFCLASLDNKVRHLSNERIEANLLFLMQHGRTVKFLDRTFNIKRDFSLRVFNFIKTHHKPGQVFQFEITADILHPDLIQWVQTELPKGLFRFEIGIQTVNREANLSVSRKQQFEKTTAVIQAVRDFVELHLDLIVGLPLDSRPDVIHSINSVLALEPPELQLGFLKFLKGTPLRDKFNQHGYVFDNQAPYTIIESNYLSKGELADFTLAEAALEIYWNAGRLKNTLRYLAKGYDYYTPLEILGKALGERRQLHGTPLRTLYETARDTLRQAYPNDAVLDALMAYDYFMQFAIRPQGFILEEVAKKEKFEHLHQAGLNTHKNRYWVFDIPLNINAFINRNEVVLELTRVAFEYDGKEKPRCYTLPSYTVPNELKLL